MNMRKRMYAALAVLGVAGTVAWGGQPPETARERFDRGLREIREGQAAIKAKVDEFNTLIAKERVKLQAEVAAMAKDVEAIRAEVTQMESALAIKREVLIDAIVKRRLAEAKLATMTPKEAAKEKP